MPEYDDISVREAIVNGLIHRQYTNVGSEVTVDIYDDRIVVTSPGPVVSGVLMNKELKPDIPSIRRNPILADIFARMHFMDRRGSGFDKIINGTNRLFNDGKNHVEFFATETYFSVVIYNANYKSGKINGGINGEINGEIKNSGIEEIILEAIKSDNYITQPNLAKKVGIGERTLSRYIKSLKDKGIIERVGSKKTGYWKVNQ